MISDKTAEERVLYSYVNPGLTNNKYTLYKDGLNSANSSWYDSIDEATKDYKNDYVVQSSLFYKVNGTYYNDFNPIDMLA